MVVCPQNLLKITKNRGKRVPFQQKETKDWWHVIYANYTNAEYQHNPALGMRRMIRAMFAYHDQQHPEEAKRITVNGHILKTFTSAEEKQAYLKKQLSDNATEWAEDTVALFALDKLGYQPVIEHQSMQLTECPFEQKREPISGLRIDLLHQGRSNLDYHWRLKDQNVSGDGKGNCFYNALSLQVMRDLPYVKSILKKPADTPLPAQRQTADQIQNEVAKLPKPAEVKTATPSREYAPPNTLSAHNTTKSEMTGARSNTRSITDTDVAMQFAYEEIASKRNSTAAMLRPLTKKARPIEYNDIIKSQQRELDYYANLKSKKSNIAKHIKREDVIRTLKPERHQQVKNCGQDVQESEPAAMAIRHPRIGKVF